MHLSTKEEQESQKKELIEFCKENVENHGLMWNYMRIIKRLRKHEEKCVKFVEHIQQHLNKGDTGLRLYKLRDHPKTVGCAICCMTIDEIKFSPADNTDRTK